MRVIELGRSSVKLVPARQVPGNGRNVRRTARGLDANRGRTGGPGDIVDRFRPGVVCQHREVARESLFRGDLERVVARVRVLGSQSDAAVLREQPAVIRTGKTAGVNGGRELLRL